MEVPRPENPSCTFKSTGVCNCSKEKTDSKMANETSAQSNRPIKGIAKE